MRAIKNLIGKMIGFGCCPNCSDSYFWKPTGSFIYEGKPTGLTKQEDGKMVLNIGIQRGVLLCTECINEPTRLDAERIASNLEKCGWEKDDTNKVLSAVDKVQTPLAA